MTTPLGPTNCAEADRTLVPSCAQDITVSGDVDLTVLFNAGYCREIYVGVAGNLVAVMKDDGGTAHTYVVAANQVVSGKFITVKSTTTAGSLIARF
jgi:hypothetical protein